MGGSVLACDDLNKINRPVFLHLLVWYSWCFLLLVVQEFHVAIRAARNLSAVQIINADAVLAAPCKASRLLPAERANP